VLAVRFPIGALSRAAGGGASTATKTTSEQLLEQPFERVVIEQVLGLDALPRGRCA
jgi:hypothetical protein